MENKSRAPTSRLRRLKRANEAPAPRRRRLLASPVLELANVSTKAGDVLGFSVRVLNWQPWYSVYQDHEYETSNFYDGPDFARAVRMYLDVLLTFKGIAKAEEFEKQVGTYMTRIESFMAPYLHGFGGAGSEDTYVKQIMPKFLGFLDL